MGLADGIAWENEYDKCEQERQKELTITDIGNYYLLLEKYKNYLKSPNINSERNQYFLKECSSYISNQLEIMNECQKLLYSGAYEKESLENKKKIRDIFEYSIGIMQDILKTFDMMLNENEITKDTDIEIGEKE